MMARSSLLLCFLAVPSYALAVKQPSTFEARSIALKMTGGSTLPPPTTPMATLKVKNRLVVTKPYLENFLCRAKSVCG